MLRNFIYKIKKSLWSKLAILCYHRVENYTCDPAKITVSNENFLKHIHYLKQYTNIIHPDQFFDSLENRKSFPKRSILLTFDDGYSSYRKTMSFLYDNSISAIFFISSRREKHWWDILSKILLQNRSINDKDFKIINSLISDLGFNFKIEKNIDFNSIDKLSGWNITDKDYPFYRNKAFYLIANKIEDADYLEQKKILKTLSNISNEKRDFSYLMNKKLIKYHRIGFHTVNHPNLSKLDYNDQQKEIELGKKDFELMIKRQINIFAYPYGAQYHYNDDTLKIVKNNFSFAFANFYGLIHKDSNYHELPRFLVKDWSIDKFEMKINKFFDY